jgi:hypothetical protein
MSFEETMNEFIFLSRPYPFVQELKILNSRLAGMLNNPYYLSVSISGLYCFDLVDLVICVQICFFRAFEFSCFRDYLFWFLAFFWTLDFDILPAVTMAGCPYYGMRKWEGVTVGAQFLTVTRIRNKFYSKG